MHKPLRANMSRYIAVGAKEMSSIVPKEEIIAGEV